MVRLDVEPDDGLARLRALEPRSRRAPLLRRRANRLLCEPKGRAVQQVLTFCATAFLNTGDQPRYADIQRLADPEQHVQRGRLAVVFQKADVAAVHARLEGQLLL